MAAHCMIRSGKWHSCDKHKLILQCSLFHGAFHTSGISFLLNFVKKIRLMNEGMEFCHVIIKRQVSKDKIKKSYIY